MSRKIVDRVRIELTANRSANELPAQSVKNIDKFRNPDNSYLNTFCKIHTKSFAPYNTDKCCYSSNHSLYEFGVVLPVRSD